MDLIDWNGRLFDSLVASVGRIGDPLYLYVDKEVLAEVGGAARPDDALADFKQSFRATNFTASLARARQFERGGHHGIPPYMCALAMTVLAVTLDPLGRSESNVYSRQRELLGLANLEGGAPPGYVDSVPDLWRHWNRWLETAGAEYGVPTARTVGRFVHQGYARSQSFMRSRDKQDIVAFFDGNRRQISHGMPGTELVAMLADWLRREQPRGRLLEVATNVDLADELALCLEAALRHWSGELQSKTKQVNIPALVQLAEGALNLVADVSQIPGAIGTTVVDFDLAEYRVSPGDRTVFLTSAEADPASWIDTAIPAHQLSDYWTVSWEPHSPIVLEGSFGGVWTEVDRVRSGPRYRVMINNESVALSRPSTIPVIGVNGWRWILSGGEPTLDAEEARVFLTPRIERAARQPLSRIEGGMPLASRGVYLCGHEPSLRVRRPMELNSVSVDGQDVTADLLPGRGDANGLLLELSELELAPGDHVAEVTDHTGVRHALRFKSVDPIATFDPLATTSTPARRIGIPLRPGFAMLVLRGGIWHRASAGPDLAPWVAELGLHRADPVERVVAISVESDRQPSSSSTLVVWRTRSAGHWSACELPGSAAQLQRQGIHLEPLADARESLSELVASARAIRYPSGSGEKTLMSALCDALQRAPTSARPSRASKAPSASRSLTYVRSDICIDRVRNLYDDFIEWVSEYDHDGVTLLRALSTFEWMRRQKRYIASVAASFRDAAKVMKTLGYIEDADRRGRIRAAASTAHHLTTSEGLAFLSGRRSEDVLTALDSGDSTQSPEVADALQDLVTYRVTQHTRDGRVRAPSTVFARLADTESASQLAALGFMSSEQDLTRLCEAGDVPSRIQDKSRRFMRAAGDKLDLFVPSSEIPFGRWRSATLPAQGAHLIRAHTRLGPRYLWWDSSAGLLTDITWDYGIWAFLSRVQRVQAIAVDPARNWLMVQDWLTLPRELEKVACLAAGLLPRVGQVRPSAATYRVYVNVQSELANAICAALEQTPVILDAETVEWL